MAPIGNEDRDTGKKGPPVALQAAILLLLTALAGGGAWFAGMYLKLESMPREKPPVPAVVEPARAIVPDDAAGGDGQEGEEARPAPRLVHLEPITTNLAAPSETWVRMECSIVFSAPPDDELVRAIHQDILAYMRTVTLNQIEGASGFQHLKVDLQERVGIRSEGLATELMIRTLLFE